MEASNVGGLGELKKARKWIHPYILQKGTQLCKPLDFGGDTHVRLLIQGNVR